MRDPDALKFRAAPTRQLLQTRRVADHKTRPSVINKLFVAQDLSDARHARSVDTQYSCDVFVRDLKAIAKASALEIQEPTAESLLDGVKRIAHNPL